MRPRRLPSPALVIALVSLFVSLGGAAVAAVPPVKRALFASNAGKLQGRTARQVAALPGPARSVARLVTFRTAEFPLAADEQRDVSASCMRGRAIAGGYSSPTTVISADSRASDPQTWSIYVMNGSATQPTTVTIQVICLL